MLAHGQEAKTTKFIELILEKVLKSKFDLRDIYIDLQHVIKLFGDKELRPDIMVFRKNGG